MKKLLFTVVCLLCCTFTLSAQDIQLPEPIKTGGKPLLEALNERQSNRTFVAKEMPLQTLSNLLWAAYGFNRENKRTVPSSQDRQEIDVYIMLNSGIYFYDAKANMLKMHAEGNFKYALGQPAVSNSAALSFIYVANMDKASNREAAFIDTGYISQNVYLYAASSGLGTVARGSFDRTKLPEVMKLGEKQEITLVQPVGYLK